MGASTLSLLRSNQISFKALPILYSIASRPHSPSPSLHSESLLFHLVWLTSFRSSGHSTLTAPSPFPSSLLLPPLPPSRIEGLFESVSHARGGITGLRDPKRRTTEGKRGESTYLVLFCHNTAKGG